MKKGFTLLETLITITIFSMVFTVVLSLLNLVEKNNKKYTTEYYNTLEICNIVDFVNNYFDVNKTVDYEIDGNNLYLTNEEFFLLFYEDHTVFNNESCGAILDSFYFKDEYLVINVKTSIYSYQLLVKGLFHEIHSNQNF